MGQGQDSQHEEIHGQQEVDVLLGEYLRQRYKEKQDVRVVGGYEETRLPAFLLEMVSPLWSWRTVSGRISNGTGGEASSFSGNGKKGRTLKPSDMPPQVVAKSRTQLSD